MGCLGIDTPVRWRGVSRVHLARLPIKMADNEEKNMRKNDPDARLPNNWKLENWHGLLRIESQMHEYGYRQVLVAKDACQHRETIPLQAQRYDEMMQRASRYFAKAERVAEYRNATYPNGAPALVEAVPHVNPKPNGDEPFILLAAAGIMEQRGIHVTARKLIDMAQDIEAELKLTAKP
jgi:hypothetical protein